MLDVLDKSKGEAITWFDGIQIVPLDEAPKLDYLLLRRKSLEIALDETVFKANKFIQP